MHDDPKIYKWHTELETMCLKNASVIVLNTSINNPPEIIQHLWNNCRLRVTVDGGANRWHTFITQNKLNCKNPDLISGDFDSATPTIVEYFVKRGSKLVHTPNQNETDFTKALKEVQKYSARQKIKINKIIVMVNMYNRIDHFLSNINTLYTQRDQFLDCKTILLGRNTMTWLLPPGLHSIQIPQILTAYPEKNYVGLFPMGSACESCTTTGLKWNINGKMMQMGGLISSSNTYNGDSVVTIANSSPLLWTMTLGFEDDF
ncbi:thiamin pyrophosphokinase 1 isoform X2 [Adelges cooleyi]|nr:thiamin pyrophosphokinase 1 isoform X2 [Adelges cooleyi]